MEWRRVKIKISGRTYSSSFEKEAGSWDSLLKDGGGSSSEEEEGEEGEGGRAASSDAAGGEKGGREL